MLTFNSIYFLMFRSYQLKLGKFERCDRTFHSIVYYIMSGFRKGNEKLQKKYFVSFIEILFQHDFRHFSFAAAENMNEINSIFTIR